MKTLSIARQTFWIVFILLLSQSCNDRREIESNKKEDLVDPSELKVKIEMMGKRFSEEFRNKDSVALADFYTSNGMLGSVKGHDNLVSAFHGMINNASNNETPDVLFKTHSITADDEYVIELGKAQWVDRDGNIKSEGKYLVVWKLENGEWKIYRDWGL